MRVRASALATVLLCLLVASAAAEVKTFRVTYLSSDHVYVNGGRSEGLEVGDRLTARRKGSDSTVLEVVYVADHSASCVIALPGFALSSGDRVEADIRNPSDAPDAATPAPAAEIVAATPAVHTAATLPTRPPSQLWGSITLGMYYRNDATASNFDFNQVTTRLNLRARRLFGRELTLSVRSRGRYDQRQRRYRSDVAKDDWEQSLWEAWVRYDDPRSPVHVTAGRLLPPALGGVGYIDGLLIEARTKAAWRIGVVGGAQPTWMYDHGRITLSKYAAYLNYAKGSSAGTRWETSIGWVGEYYSSTVSRMFVTMMGNFSTSGRLSLNYTGDLDINSGWRKTRSGQSLQVTNIYANAYYQFSRRVRLGFSYDSRQNYWTYELQTLADSLFSDAIRRGGRMNLDLGLTSQIRLNTGLGIRGFANGTSPTYTYFSNLYLTRLFQSRATMWLQFGGFSGPEEDGLNYALRVSYLITPRLSLAAGYGSYQYSAQGIPGDVKNGWCEFTSQWDVSRHYFLTWGVQLDSGDDLRGQQLRFDTGYRF